jgi:hypothetical protein
MYSFSISDMQTGQLLSPMKGWERPSAGRYATRANGFESGQHTFQLNSSDFSRDDWRYLISPWRRTIDIDWDGQLVYSGLIMGTNYKRNTGALTVASAEVRTILARRGLFGIGTYENGTKVLNGRSLRGLIYQILYYATQGGLSSVWDLPFKFPAFDEPGLENHTYWNYLFESADTMISDIEETVGGPDTHLKAQRTVAGLREWLVRVGNPRLDGPLKEFMASGSAPDALNLESDMDGTLMRTGTWAIGSGSEQDILHGEAATVAVPGGFPSLDVPDQFKNIEVQEELDAHALARNNAFMNPTEQVAFDVLARDFLPDGTVGSTVKVWDSGDKWMPDGWTSRYCIGFSGDMSNVLRLELQEV